MSHNLFDLLSTVDEENQLLPEVIEERKKSIKLQKEEKRAQKERLKKKKMNVNVFTKFSEIVKNLKDRKDYKNHKNFPRNRNWKQLMVK